MSTEKPPVEVAVEKIGGPSEAARKLKISNPSVVANWLARGQVSAGHCLALERESGVSRHTLRPDLHGPAPQQAAA